MNKVILCGRVGKQPESRFTASGAQVVTFSLATSEKFKDKQGEKKEVVTWHNLVLWQKTAEIAEKYVNKGDQLLIEGKISNRSYDDRDGNKKYISEVIVSNLEMLGSKNSGQGQNDRQSNQQNQSQQGAGQQQAQGGYEEPVFNPEDEIPF